MDTASPALVAIIVIIISTCCAGQQHANDTQNSVSNEAAEKATVQELVCPPASVFLPFFSIPCKTDRDCSRFKELCCDVDGKKRCRKGVPKPTPKPTHQPFFGIRRECPEPPVIELLPVKNCTKDADCWPRICCPEGVESYCRTSLPYTETSKDFPRLRSMVPYFQCTPPPPPLLDLFPKPCRSPIDCIPNLCCQENGRKVCRPPRKSVIGLLLGIMQRFG